MVRTPSKQGQKGPPSILLARHMVTFKPNMCAFSLTNS